jgi:hypothetical protein
MSDFWASILIGAGLGFGLGIFASYIAWWVNYHRIKPQANFSIEIAKRKVGEKIVFYQVAFENAGKRKMVDIDIVVRVGIKNFKGAGGWGYHAIRTNASRVPDLSPGEESRRLVRVFDNREELEFVDIPSKSIREVMKSCQSLEELLSLGSDANVQVHVFGFDAFSGTRRHLPSKKYKRADIRTGRFKGLDVVEERKKYSAPMPLPASAATTTSHPPS